MLYKCHAEQILLIFSIKGCFWNSAIQREKYKTLITFYLSGINGG